MMFSRPVNSRYLSAVVLLSLCLLQTDAFAQRGTQDDRSFDAVAAYTDAERFAAEIALVSGDDPFAQGFSLESARRANRLRAPQGGSPMAQSPVRAEQIPSPPGTSSQYSPTPHGSGVYPTESLPTPSLRPSRVPSSQAVPRPQAIPRPQAMPRPHTLAPTSPGTSGNLNAPQRIAPQQVMPSQTVPYPHAPTPMAQPTHTSISQAPQSDEALYSELSAAADSIATSIQSTRYEAPTTVKPGWWQSMVPRSLRSDAEDIPLTLEETLYEALANSEQVKVFQQLPPIRQTAIVEADAAFDWNAFLETQWDDLSDPVGNTLTAGPGITRFRDHNIYGTGGVRKRTRTGGQWEVSQRLGHQDNNSRFFQPVRQGTSQITLGFTQPLMRGRGKVYNTSLICLANIDHAVAKDEYMRQLQTHLLEVSRSYWAVYLERGVLYQKLRTYDRAQKIVHRLKLRRAVDATESQIKTAAAALMDRQSELVRAFTAVKNSEARLRSLVNSPRLGDYESLEILPVDSPSFEVIPVEIEQAVGEAVQQRPEVKQAIKQIRAASIRMGMAKHELLPVLNLVTNTYVAGLSGGGDVGRSWVNQFNQGEPGYSIGLQFEVPLGNRAAKARSQRRNLELRQLQHQYQVTLQTVQLEVKVAVREVDTAKNELLSKQHVVMARESQLDQLIQRWEQLPNEQVTTSLVLENILRAQRDLARAEYEYLQSQITYNLSRVNLRKATGTLFQHQSINVQ